MWTCPFCETINQEDGELCRACGSLRPKTSPVRKPAPAPQPREEQLWETPLPAEDRGRTAGGKRKLILGLALGLLCLALAGTGLFLLLGRNAGHYRVTRYYEELWDGSTSEDRYSYSGSTGRIESYKDGTLSYISTLTCDKNGTILTEDYRRANEELVFRFTYEYDRDGNQTAIYRYTPSGLMDLKITRRYNAYRVVEHSETTYYDENGKMESKTVMDFSDPAAGLSYELDAAGQRTDKWTYKRIYDAKNNLTEEWCYYPNGDFFRVMMYERDKTHRVLKATTRYYDGDESRFTYEYERVK